jgi:ABC-type multidrug transport system permease subunit
MTFLPIVLRELGVRSKKKSTYWFRQAGAMVAITIVTFMLMGASVGSPSATLGSTVFGFMAWLAFLYCLIEGARNTADCLSEEKRSGTLGLLFLTDLKGYDVVFGKMMATSLNSIYVLIAILPPMAMPLLLGGVTGGEFWRLVLVLISTLFLSLAVGLFVSALSRDSQRAWATAYLLIILLVVVGAPGVYLPPLEAVSPTVAFLGMSDAAYRVNPDDYWRSVIGITLLSLALFAAASVALPRVWQERSIALPVWLQKKLPSAQESPARVLARKRLLARNPVAWAAERGTGRPACVWVFVGCACVVGIISMIVAPGSPAVGTALLVSAVIMHFLLSVWAATEACHLFPHARQSGALELLLCTPVTVSEIVEGHFRALHRLFAGPVVLLIATEFVLALSYIYARGSGFGPVEAFVLIGIVTGGIALFVLDLFAVARFGMWMGLKSRKAGVAVTKTVAFVLVLPWLAVLPCIFAAIFLPIGMIVKDLIFINYGQEQIARQFRKAAIEAAGLEAARLTTPRLPPVLQ